MGLSGRKQPLWWAHILHRLSGLALALFLPFHFWVLTLALTGPERMDAFFHWTDNWAVKLAEAGLVFLLAAHIGGGLRLMSLEHLGWTGRQKAVAAWVVGLAVLAAGLFLMRAI